MKRYQLTNEEALASGFTHKAVICAADGDFTAAAVTQSYALDAPAAGQIIDRAARRVVTPLNGGATSEGTTILGDGDDDNGFLTAQSAHADATSITCQAGDGALLNQAGGKAYSAAGALTAVLTTTGANVSALTTGEIHFFWRKVDLNKL